MIYICSDVHGDKSRIEEVIDQIHNPTEEDKIIICGDAGFEYGGHIMGSAKKAAAKFPGSWIVMRGNHDTRYWRDHAINVPGVCEYAKDNWHMENINGNMLLVQDKYPNIKYVRDEGGIYYIDGYKFLFVPGAYSVDKKWRIAANMPYEQEEQLTYKEFCNIIDVAKINGNEIDFVISHTAPLFLEEDLQYLFLDIIDQNEVDKTTEQGLDQVAHWISSGINFKHWFFGHYHDTKTFDGRYSMMYHRVLRLEDYV